MSEIFYKLSCDLARRVDLTWADKGIYSILADRIGHNGKCWPGVRRLANDSGLNSSTVKRAIHRLEQFGLITVEHGRGRRSNSYTVFPVNGCKKHTQGNGCIKHYVRVQKAHGYECKKHTEPERLINQSKAHPPKITFDPEQVTFKGITDQDLSRWATTYPTVDVSGEIRKSAEWLNSNPSRRKKDNRRFITNWLGRAVEYSRKKETDPAMDEARYAAMEAAGKFDDFDRAAGLGDYAKGAK